MESIIQAVLGPKKEQHLLLIFHGPDAKRYVLEQKDPKFFKLGMRHNTLTAAVFLLRPYFPTISEVDMFYPKKREFQKAGIEYRVVKFSLPVLEGDGKEGLASLTAAGFSLVPLEEHALRSEIGPFLAV